MVVSDALIFSDTIAAGIVIASFFKLGPASVTVTV